MYSHFFIINFIKILLILIIIFLLESCLLFIQNFKYLIYFLIFKYYNYCLNNYCSCYKLNYLFFVFFI